MPVNFRICTEDLVPAIRSLEDYFREGGTTIVQAAFKHTYFIDPEAVRKKTPYYENRARRSREHYPGIDKGKETKWKAGDGSPLLIRFREAPSTTSKSVPNGQRVPTVPITLDPSNSEDFLAALLRTKKAWLEVSYQDGRKEVRPWEANQMKPTSNVIGNLRSRPEFRKDTWQKHGIASLRVSIEQPGGRQR